MDVTNQYPSTNDMPPIKGGQQDLTLELMERANERVTDSWTSGAYISYDGSVCALGAIMAASGLDDEEEDPRYEVWYENLATDAAKEAIDLLNVAALELYPEAEEYKKTSWAGGPLEYLNQTLLNDSVDYAVDLVESYPTRRRVLNCYAKAIADRKDVDFVAPYPELLPA